MSSSTRRDRPKTPQHARRLRRALCLGSAAAVLVSVAACSSTTASNAKHSSASNGSPQTGGTLNVDVGDVSITTLDPAKGSANAMALGGDMIYDTLLTVPKIGDPPQPNIAKTMTASDNGLTWTMTLPTGVKFSDGTAFNAAAVKYNMDRDMAPTSSAAALLSLVKSVDAPNPTTVIFHMKAPFAGFPNVFAYDGSGTAGYIASPTALQKWGSSYTAHASGVGPFMLQSWAPNSTTVLVRNPNYWNKANRPVYLDKAVLKIVADDQSAYQAVKAGDLDLMGTADPAVLAAAQKDSSVRVVMGDSNDNQDSIILNLATQPFNDLNLRKAVSMALNREQIAALTTNGLGKPAVNLFPAGNPYHDSASDPTFNLSAAKQLTSQYKQAHGGQAPTFTYTCNNQRPATDVIVQQLSQAGFNVKVRAEDTSSWVADYFAKKYQAICWTMAPFLTPGLLPYRFFYSSGDLNTDGFKSSAFDSAADAARAATSPEQQKAEWAKADQVLTEQLPWVWTTSGPIGFILSPRVHGIDYDQPSRLRYYVPTFGNEWLSK